MNVLAGSLDKVTWVIKCITLLTRIVKSFKNVIKYFFLKLILKLIYVLFSEQSGEKILCFNVRCPNVPAELRCQKRMFRRVVIGHTMQEPGMILKKKYVSFLRFHLKKPMILCCILISFVSKMKQLKSHFTLVS